MGYFADRKKNMGSATPSAGGNYITPGKYLAMIERVLLKPSENPRSKNDDHYIVELRIIESEQTDADRPPKVAGAKTSWLVGLPGQYEDLALGNIKGFLIAAFGSWADAKGEERPADDDIDDEMTDYSYSDEGPLVGVLVAADAYNIKTGPDKKNDFTKVEWTAPTPEQRARGQKYVEENVAA